MSTGGVRACAIGTAVLLIAVGGVVGWTTDGGDPGDTTPRAGVVEVGDVPRVPGNVPRAPGDELSRVGEAPPEAGEEPPRAGAGTARTEDPGPPFSEIAPVSGFDDVVVVIRVAGDRSAEWSVNYRYRLDDETGNETFERARRNVTNPPGVFVDRMRDAARRAERRTGRDMAVQNGSVTAYRSVPHGRFGIVEYRLTWTGFAARGEDGRIVVGDVLGGYPVGDNESLVIGWANVYRVVDVSPPPNATTNSSVRWEGPRKFGVENPRVVLARTETAGDGSFLANPLLLMVVGGVLVAAAVTVVFGIRPALLVDRLGSNARGPGDEEGKEPPAELLSDEERVLRLLEDNGGRMKQQDVKEALDWSRTKTSNVVNDMQDDGKIEVYRLGRENTLALPGEMDL